MKGTGNFARSGGTLMVPDSNTTQAFVQFHDLQPLDAKAHLAVWLVSADDKQWVRAADFWPSGERYQRVDLNTEVAGFGRCAVTVEYAMQGRPSGNVVMQSSIAYTDGAQ
jgi:hypothetical protein